MYTCLYYWLIAPLRGGLEDTPDRQPAFTLNVHALDDKVYEIGLYCDPQGQPEFARLAIPELQSEAIPEAVLPLIQSIQEHLLSTLRLTFKSDAMLAQPSTVWSFIADGTPKQTKLVIQEFGGQTYDPNKTKDLFIHTFNVRELIRLFVDGVDTRIPLQYRFLSLYKVLENRFRKQSRWDHKALAAILEPHKISFERLGFHGTPASTLHDLRDRCAHIKTGKDVLGVTHLNLKEAARVESILPYLRATCATVINERADGKFALVTEVIHDGLRPIPTEV